MSAQPVDRDAPLTLTIGGRPISTAETMAITNPADESIAGWSPVCTEGQLDDAFAAADAAFDSWSHLEPGEREKYLVAAADAIDATADELGLLLALELGRALPETVGEASLLASYLRHFAPMRLPEVTIHDDGTSLVRVVRRPLGVVAALTPWNSPLAIMGMKIGPALSAGNTVVVKPSPLAPLSTLRAGEILREVLPPGVLNVIAGDDALGPLVSKHSLARKVSFSGSIGVGKKIAESAAPDLKRVTLELGGNDAAIVLADVDVPTVARSMFRAAFVGCGQACVALKRVYAVPEVYDQLVHELAELADAAVVGDPLAAGTQLGSMVTDTFRRRIDDLVTDAVGKGAKVAAGGTMIEGPGYFYRPTIVAEATEGMRLVDEEQFGPALPIIRCADADDGFRRANATQFALAASIWSGDADRARAIAEDLEAGTVWINTHRINIGPAQPIGGWKWSGIGVENGPWGLESFTDLKTLYEYTAN